MKSGFVLAAILVLCPCAVRAEDFKPGPRPDGALFDPAGVLREDARAEISLPLERIRKDAEVIAVVLTNMEAATPEEAAAKMAVAWCHAPLHAVVLHVPGRDGSPWIVAGGDMIHVLNPDEVRDELAAARRDASREPDDASKVRTAATATSDLLRYWKGREDSRLAAVEKTRIGIRRELEARASRHQAIMLAAAAALIIGVIAVVRLKGKNRRSSDKP